jgi:hypothetical protein
MLPLPQGLTGPPVAFFDTVVVWLRHPVDKVELRRLRKWSGRGGLHVVNAPLRSDYAYRQRLEFRQPDRRALQWIVRRDDVIINRLDFALDLAFVDRLARSEARAFLDRHLVRLWHGRRQGIRFFDSRGEVEAADRAERLSGDDGGTRYDGPRRAANVVVLYPEGHSRITGEIGPRLHIEWRARGLPTVRDSLGIETGADLLAFDHVAFWSKRLLLVDIDEEALGRRVRNHMRGLRSRDPETRVYDLGGGRQVIVNGDQRLGKAILAGFGTRQEARDTIPGDYLRDGKPVRLDGLLKRIPVTEWLPLSLL